MTDAERREEVKGEEEDGAVAAATPVRRLEDEYTLLRPIGRGKFAIVHCAKRNSDDVMVAVKKIQVETMNQRQRDKCLKEVRLLQSLDHPNIVRYLDSFLEGEELVIVMEWAASGDLKRQLRKALERDTLFEERVVWKYFSQIAEALQHMHSRRVMHRDLKPANILLTPTGQVKVGDLGLGRELSEQTLEAHSKVGTPLYMSPEVLRGGGYDFKSDVWSLGCLLYELAMLKSPFKVDGLNLYALFQKISRGDYEQLPDYYSEELRNLTYAMVSTNAADRPDMDRIVEFAGHMRQVTMQQAAARREQKQREGEAGGSSMPRGTSFERDPSLGRPDSARSATPGEGQAEEKARDADDRPRTRSGHRRRRSRRDGATENKGTPTLGDYLGAGAPADGDALVDPRERRRARSSAEEKRGRGGEAYERDGGADERDGAISPDENQGYDHGRHPNAAYEEADAPVRRSLKPSVVKPLAPPNNRRQPGGVVAGPAVGRLQVAVDPGAGLGSVGPATTEMAQLLDLLRVLGYDLAQRRRERGVDSGARLPLVSLMHFALPAPQDHRAGSQAGAYVLTRHQQFIDFLSVGLWLLECLPSYVPSPGLSVTAIDTDVPQSLTKLLLVTIGASFPEPRDGQPLPRVNLEVNLTALTPGSGLAVCQLLRELAEMVSVVQGHGALARAGDEPPALVYISEESPTLDALQADDVDAGEESVEDVEDLAEAIEEPDRPALTPREITPSGVEGVLEANVDPALWRQELERVTPQLRARRRARNAGLGWAARLGEARAAYGRLGGKTPGSGSGAPGLVAGEPRPESRMKFQSMSVTKGLGALGETLADAEGRLRTGEAALTQTHAVLVTQHASLAAQQREVATEAAELAADVRVKAVESEALGDAVAAIREAVRERGEGASDATPVVEIREALRHLKAEVKDLDRDLGLVNGAILRHQRRATARARDAARQRIARRRSREEEPDYSLGLND